VNIFLKITRYAFWPGSPKGWNFGLDWQEHIETQGVYVSSFKGSIHIVPVIAMSSAASIFFGGMAATAISPQELRSASIAMAIGLLWLGLNIIRLFAKTLIVFDSTNHTMAIMRCIGRIVVLKSRCRLDDLIVCHCAVKFAGIIASAPIGITYLLMPNGERVLLAAGGSPCEMAETYSYTPLAKQVTAAHLDTVVQLLKYALI